MILSEGERKVRQANCLLLLICSFVCAKGKGVRE